MKNVFRTATVGMLSLPTIAALALPASASRVGSSETVSSGSGWMIVLIAAAVLALIAVLVVVLMKKSGASQSDQPIMIGKPKDKHHATLEAQGAFLGGKHYGIVTKAVIGRSSSADIHVNEPKVSGTHCQVTWENGALYLTDLGSTNGTVVAGTGTIPARMPVRLYPDSVFWIGEERCAFRVKMK